MKKLVAILAVGLLLTGCAGFQQFVGTVEADAALVKSRIAQTFTPDNLDTIEDSYGAIMAVAVAYRNLCQSKVINKSCWITIAKIQPYQLKAQNAVVTLRKFIAANPNLDASSFIQIARASINAFNTYQTSLGVR